MNPGALSNHIFGTHVLFDVKTTTVYGLLTGKKKKKSWRREKAEFCGKGGRMRKPKSSPRFPALRASPAASWPGLRQLENQGVGLPGVNQHSTAPTPAALPGSWLAS